VANDRYESRGEQDGTRDVIDTTGLFNGERAALLELLRSLGDKEWWLPTDCGDWTVHDVALHLIGVDVNVLAGDRDAFRNPPSVEVPDLANWDTLVAYINARNQIWVDAHLRVSPRLTCELLETTGRLLDAYWPTIDLTAIGNPVSWAGPELAPVWVHIAREYTERWTHQQHIRDATNRPGMTDPEWLHPVLDTFMLALPHTLRQVPATAGIAVEAHVTGPAGGRWWAERSGDAWILTKQRPNTVMATVTVDQDTAWRLFTRGIQPSQARARVEIVGDPALGNSVLDMISIIA
jgi:uncharacterized protein (TIGR03083 family)